MKITPQGFAVLEYDTHISKWCEQEGRLDHDQNALPVILPYIKEGDWIIDGGAFIGDHTVAYLDKTKTGMVFAFEPNPDAYNCLTFNCPQAVCVQSGLGMNGYEMGLHIQENVGASFGIEGDSINVMALDSFSFPRLNFIKLDIEGMEYDALCGAVGNIQKHRPIIVCEINRSALERNATSFTQITSLMETLNYKVKKMYESDDWSSPMFDVFFLP